MHIDVWCSFHLNMTIELLTNGQDAGVPWQQQKKGHSDIFQIISGPRGDSLLILEAVSPEK